MTSRKQRKGFPVRGASFSSGPQDIKSISIALPTLCDNHCIFCFDTEGGYRHPAEPIRDITDFKIKVLYAIKLGFRGIKFTGGESLNYPQIIELVKFARLRGVQNIGIETTGRKLKERVFLRALVDAGVTSFRIPLYGTTRACHERITRTPGSFKDVIQALDNLAKTAVEVRLCFLILKQNYKHIVPFTRFVLSCYPRFKTTCSEVLPFSHSYLDYKRIAAAYYKYVPLLRDRVDILNRQTDDTTPLEHVDSYRIQVFLPYCIVTAIIGKDALLPAFFLKRSFRDYRFNKEKVLSTCQERQKVPFCKKCKFFLDCGGILKQYLESYGSKEFNPVC